MYEALRSEVMWETNLAAGALSHACGFDEADSVFPTYNINVRSAATRYLLE